MLSVRMILERIYFSPFLKLLDYVKIALRGKLLEGFLRLPSEARAV